MKLTQKKSFYILLAASAISALAILWFDYQFLIKDIAKSSANVLTLRKNIALMQGQLLKAASFRQEENQIRRERELIKPFSSFSDGLSFINTLEDLAKIAGTSLSFDIQGDKQPMFRIQVSGNFANILDFLERVATTPTKIQLSQILKDTSLAGQSLLRADITLTPSLASPVSK